MLASGSNCVLYGTSYLDLFDYDWLVGKSLCPSCDLIYDKNFNE